MYQEDEASIWWLLDNGLRGNVLYISAHAITTSMRTVNDVQVKKWVGAVSVDFQPEHRKTLAEVGDAVSLEIDASAGFSDLDPDALIVEHEIFEEDVPRDLQDLTYNDYRGPSTLQHVQELYRTYGLLVPSDVRSVQEVVKNALVALPFAGGHEVTLANF